MQEEENSQVETGEIFHFTKTVSDIIFLNLASQSED